MKKMLLPLLLALSAFPCCISASDKPYTMCSVAGYYEGNDNRFMHELAMRVIVKNQLNTNSECISAMKTGKEVAIKTAKPGRLKNEEDAEVIFHVEHFSNLIYDSILSRVKFD